MQNKILFVIFLTFFAVLSIIRAMSGSLYYIAMAVFNVFALLAMLLYPRRIAVPFMFISAAAMVFSFIYFILSLFA